MAPDLRRKVDANRAARLAREAEMKKQVDAQVSGFGSSDSWVSKGIFSWGQCLMGLSLAEFLIDLTYSLVLFRRFLFPLLVVIGPCINLDVL